MYLINILYCLFLSWLIACASQSKPKEELNKETKHSNSLKTNELIVVQISESVKKPFDYIIQSMGKVEAKQKAELKFKIAGYLPILPVQNGQFVQAGQVIAQLDSKVYQLALRKAQNTQAVAYEKYIIEFINYGGDLQNPDKLDKDIHTRIRVRTGLREAELQVQEAEIQLAYCQLISPFSGKISDLKVKPNNDVNAQQAICSIYSTNNLEVITEVLETEISRLQIGQKAKVTTLGNKNYQYEASLSEINPQVSMHGMVQIKLKLLNSQDLLPGMNTLVQISVPQAETVVVPKNAIVIRSGKKVIFTEENGLAKWNYVVSHLENNEEVSIQEGLTAGKRVIISNNLQLAHDSPVKIQVK